MKHVNKNMAKKIKTLKQEHHQIYHQRTDSPRLVPAGRVLC